MPSAEDLQRELEQLRAENAALRQSRDRPLTIKVSEKGGVSVYGLGRFPVTLYVEQWTTLLDNAEMLRSFMRDHASELKRLERGTGQQA